MEKTPEEIKKGMEYLSTRDPAKKFKLWQEGIAYDWQEDAAADALAYIQQLEAQVPRWIPVEERPPVWPCVVYDGCNPPYTPRGCIVMLHDKDGAVKWIPDVPLDALLQGNMPEIRNIPITHWMLLPQPPKEE